MFEQMSVIKFLVTENCKPCEIYRRIFDVHGKTCFSKKTIYKWVKYWFATISLTWKDMERKHTDSLKKKFQVL